MVYSPRPSPLVDSIGNCPFSLNRVLIVTCFLQCLTSCDVVLKMPKAHTVPQLLWDWARPIANCATFSGFGGKMKTLNRLSTHFSIMKCICLPNTLNWYRFHLAFTFTYALRENVLQNNLIWKLKIEFCNTLFQLHCVG